MKHLGLFEGIGGFSLAARWMGWETVAWVEINPFCQAVLRRDYEYTKGFNDVRTFSRRDFPYPVDAITAGFPCQDLSIAGKGKGITGERSGLWQETYRIVDEYRPKVLVLENSPELLKKGFEKVLYPLSEIGYNVEWDCIRVSEYGAPHHRERVYVVAYPNTYGLQKILPLRRELRKKSKQKGHRQFAGTTIQAWGAWKTEPPVLRMDDGVPNRAHRIGALGNSVCPYIAFEIFQAIEKVNAGFNNSITSI